MRRARRPRPTRSLDERSTEDEIGRSEFLCLVRRTVLIYGLLAGVLLAVLQVIQYRFLIIEHALEVYGGLVAAIFTGLGIWLGLKMTGRKTEKEIVVVQEAKPFAVDQKRLEQLGITAREHEILTLIAAGLSTREIAEKLFVSENTVKTHSSRLFAKLNARRRTQAVQIAKEHGLIA
jgi:DNA-binding CsgD family transcriptional regulator